MIDIVLATYNGEKYLAEQLESILDSEYADFKLFVYDDGSTDNTTAIVKDFMERYPDKIFLAENIENLGYCKNFLEGLKYTAKIAPADYYVFCDQDDVWLENRLSVCLHRMKELEEQNGSETPILLFTDAVLVDEEMNSMGTTFFKADRLNTDKLDLARLLMENKCIGCTSFMNAALVEKLDGFDKRTRYHDWWMALIASAFGKVSYLDVPTVLYRQHSDNQVGQSDFAGYVKNRTAGKKSDARKRLKLTMHQARAFYKYYGDKLDDEQRQLLKEFSVLDKVGGLERRRLIIRNGFFKSGFVRNIGLMLYI